MAHGGRVPAGWKVESPHAHRLEDLTESSLGPAFPHAVSTVDESLD